MNSSCSSASSCGCVDRRSFLKLSGAAALSLTLTDQFAAIAGPFEPKDTADHFVPVDKKLRKEWLAALFAKGEPTWYAGDDLKQIAMPVGGIGAGQLYLAGDGRLIHWDIFNDSREGANSGTHYQRLPTPVAPLKQGFAIRARAGGKTLVRSLDREGFPGVRFRGEYPIATVQYADAEFPVSVTMEAFSPFIPLNAADSALPATVLHFTIKNTSSAPAEVVLAGRLENGVCCHSGDMFEGVRQNKAVKGNKLTMMLGSARAVKTPEQPKRPPVVLADFEGANYGDWKAEGEAFGAAPAKGTLQSQQPVSGFAGKGLVNTFLGGDQPHGKLTSPKFTVERAFLNFLIGGGNHRGRTCINLLVGGKQVRTATGPAREQLAWQSWNAKEFLGQQAQIEIVDRESGPWGHINIDQVELSDAPRRGLEGPLETQRDFGTMGLALLGDAAGVTSMVDLPDNALAALLNSGVDLDRPASEEKPLGQSMVGALSKTVVIPAGFEARVSFVIAWCFPNLPQHGNRYATRFADAQAVAQYVADNFDRLAGQTRLWRDTWYDSTLPWWLLDRLFMPVSILASSTCQWRANGRFWAWEGVRCCAGTCAHVWNYEHSMARLFPELERSVREMQDFGPGFVEATGAINFRGESNNFWAGDSQGGTVMKCLREHQMSANGDFLKRNWPRIRKTAEFLLNEDKDDDGLIEGSQHNTYDINFHGPNTMIGSLYLGALRAAEEMAKEVGDVEFAVRCRKVFEAGSKNTVERLFNGEYFIQQVDLKKYPRHQYGEGCLADQLFGQGWAHQVGLGYIYPKDKVLSALKAIWTYDWAPDIGPQNAAHPPQRWFARPGEAGLFTCTWPKSKHLGPESVLYRDEIWTGIEYQVAGHMAWEGMTTEALAICRGVHERYHPLKQNPWNEVECGDHYARAMASHGVFLSLCGFECHGPHGHIGFAPRLTPENFRAAFTSAEGWGTISQKSEIRNLKSEILVKWGTLRVRTLALGLPKGVMLDAATVTIAGQKIEATAKQEGDRVTLSLAGESVAEAGKTVEVSLTWQT
ncbi:MAG: hypothetical protein HZA90_06440 [Verrucomicrobia bacterium]|nr:hypothetical protein [Verrucomicrobiota bacterium]